MPVLSSTDENYEKLEDIEDTLDQAEASASSSGKKILETSRTMIANQDIIIGGCWDFVHEAFNRAGFPSGQRATIYSTKLRGPYADSVLIEPGDWLYYVNHSFGQIEHSGVFVAWTNMAKKEALIMSYKGGNNANPARYKKYLVKDVYNIIRAR